MEVRNVGGSADHRPNDDVWGRPPSRQQRQKADREARRAQGRYDFLEENEGNNNNIDIIDLDRDKDIKTYEVDVVVDEDDVDVDSEVVEYEVEDVDDEFIIIHLF